MRLQCITLFLRFMVKKLSLQNSAISTYNEELTHMEPKSVLCYNKFAVMLASEAKKPGLGLVGHGIGLVKYGLEPQGLSRPGGQLPGYKMQV